MNLRSLDETLLDCAFADIASFADDFIALLPAAAVVPTLLEPCVLAVTCAPTAAAKQNETAPTSAGSEYLRDMGFLRWVADLAPRGAGALGRYGASESSCICNIHADRAVRYPSWRARFQTRVRVSFTCAHGNFAELSGKQRPQDSGLVDRLKNKTPR
ncbi:MAG TPA: hypothetical protein VGL96_13055 [Casimicrobiaceae bacterium]